MTRPLKSRRHWIMWFFAPVVVYLVLVGLMYTLQDRLIFVGATWGRGVEVQTAPGVQLGRLAGPEGEFRIAVGQPEAHPKALVIGFVGNGEDLRSAVRWAFLWREYGVASVMVEYPGYGDSEGAPSQRGFLLAAEVAAAHARKLADQLSVSVVAMGSSLGSFSAMHVAAQGMADRVLLFAPPTSMVDAASGKYPWLPVRFLLRHPFDNMGPAVAVKVPVLIVHGDQDRIVPVDHGRRLKEAIGDHAELIVVPGAGHNDLPIHRGGVLSTRLSAFVAGP